jgi:hypothetical protein
MDADDVSGVDVALTKIRLLVALAETHGDALTRVETRELRIAFAALDTYLTTGNELPIAWERARRP